MEAIKSVNRKQSWMRIAYTGLAAGVSEETTHAVVYGLHRLAPLLRVSPTTDGSVEVLTGMVAGGVAAVYAYRSLKRNGI